MGSASRCWRASRCACWRGWCRPCASRPADPPGRMHRRSTSPWPASRWRSDRMKVRWFGQSAFALSGSAEVFIDPFGDMSSMAGRGMTWTYPAITAVAAELLLVTHEHRDHNAVDAIEGVKQTIRSSTGTFETPIGLVVGVASEHDDVAGTKRGANVIYVFELDGM